MSEELIAAAQKLVAAVGKDVNGVPGMPFSGNGGLISNDTIRASDELRLAVARHQAAARREPA
jgi:hypothetical protein